MPASLRLALIACSVLMLLHVALKIRKSAMKLEDCIIWIAAGVFFIIISAFPNIIYVLCRVLGIMSPSNLVYLVVIAFLLLQIFYNAIKISTLSARIDSLAQELALRDERFIHTQTRDQELQKEK
jgi:hypothetical protein